MSLARKARTLRRRSQLAQTRFMERAVKKESLEAGELQKAVDPAEREQRQPVRNSRTPVASCVTPSALVTEDPPSAFPQWVPGLAVECSFREEDGRVLWHPTKILKRNERNGIRVTVAFKSGGHARMEACGRTCATSLTTPPHTQPPAGPTSTGATRCPKTSTTAIFAFL